MSVSNASFPLKEECYLPLLKTGMQEKVRLIAGANFGIGKATAL